MKCGGQLFFQSPKDYLLEEVPWARFMGMTPAIVICKHIQIIFQNNIDEQV